MINELQTLSSYMNVTGAEAALARHIARVFRTSGIKSEIDNCGNVIARFSDGASSDRKEKTLLCTPLDNPGFLSLYLEGTVSYLTPTEKALSSRKDCKIVLDEKNEKHLLKKSKYSKPPFCVDLPNARLGQAFRLPSDLSRQDRFLSGRYVSRYALIQIMIDLVLEKQARNTVFCFSTGFHSLASSEANFVFREKFQNVVLLGYVEEKTEKPVVMVKNGKQFSSPYLLEKAVSCGKTYKIPLYFKADDKPCSCAESVSCAGTCEIATLALPCRDAGSEKERVAESSVLDLKNLLKKMLNM